MEKSLPIINESWVNETEVWPVADCMPFDGELPGFQLGKCPYGTNYGVCRR